MKKTLEELESVNTKILSLTIKDGNNRLISNDDIISKLSKDVNKLQNNIRYRNLYNIRNIILKILVKSGIAIDYALPFMISAVIISNSIDFETNPPFTIDEIKEKAKVETIDSSSGFHIEHISYDFDYDTESLAHSTGWMLNTEGLYERVVTSYRISDQIDLSDTETIFNMPKEEIDNALVITNIKTIKKNILTEEDSIYNQDALIIINNFESEEDFLIREETIGENILNSIKYIFLISTLGVSFMVFEKLLIKNCIKDKLITYEQSLKWYDKEELKTMKKILELKKENLSMLTDSEYDVNKTYKLNFDKKGDN